MTMNLTDGVNNNGLFDLQGKAIDTINDLNTFAGTTLPGNFDAIVTGFEAATGYPLDFQSAIQGLPSALTSWQTAGQTLASAVQTYCRNLLAEMVNNEAAYQAILQADNLQNQLEFLAAEMVTADDYVDPNVVAGTLTAGSNTGDTAIVWTLANADGAQEQNAYAETLTLEVAANPSATTPSITITGEPSTPKLAADWPQGSGANTTLRATNPASSLVSNGTFAEATVANTPDDWVLAVGLPGTKIAITAPEQQTVAIAGSPTGGTYTLKFTTAGSITWSTAALAYDSTASQVQTALRAIPGLSLVTVASTGTSPNLTHTVTFTGVGGNIAQLTSTSMLTGGTPSIAHATTVAGDAGDYRGSTLKLIGDSSTLHAIYAPLTGLKPGTTYACHFRMKRTGTATSASMTAGIVQSIGGAILNDPGGTANSVVIDLSAVSDSTHESQSFTFRLPDTAQSPVYLRLACTVAIPTAATIYVADVAIAAMSQAYPGGPFFAAFSGIAASIAGDSWTLAVTNDRAGEWQTAYCRYFNTETIEFFLPTTGTNNIADSLIG